MQVPYITPESPSAVIANTQLLCAQWFPLAPPASELLVLLVDTKCVVLSVTLCLDYSSGLHPTALCLKCFTLYWECRDKFFVYKHLVKSNVL